MCSLLRAVLRLKALIQGSLSLAEEVLPKKAGPIGDDEMHVLVNGAKCAAKGARTELAAAGVLLSLVQLTGMHMHARGHTHTHTRMHLYLHACTLKQSCTHARAGFASFPRCLQRLPMSNIPTFKSHKSTEPLPRRLFCIGSTWPCLMALSFIVQLPGFELGRMGQNEVVGCWAYL
eukprot:1149347-Pelagomonas_calceolata.AAC.1